MWPLVLPVVFQRVLISICGTTYRHRQNLRGLVRLRGQRCDGERRNYLPHWSEEAVTSAGDCHAEQAALCVPRGQRGSLPATPGSTESTAPRLECLGGDTKC